MAVTSPTSPSPGLSLLEWDESAVHSYLCDLGVNQYEDMINEHGITGEVLCVMDHAALQDLGMGSLGQRLAVLRAVWELKKEQGIDISEDDWRPQDADNAAVPTPSADRLWELLMEQHERLIHLERDHARLLSTLEDNGIVVPVATSADGDLLNGIQGIGPNGDGSKQHELGRGLSLRLKNGSRSDGEDEGMKARRSPTLFSSSLNSSTNSNAPLTSDSATFQDSFTPTTANGPTYPFDSPSQLNSYPAKPSAIPPPPFKRLMSGSEILGTSVSSPPADSRATPPSQILSLSSKSAQSVNLAPQNQQISQSGSANGSTTEPSEKAKSSAKDAAKSAAKSFRVTLEDPCWKVLPAALKKYKINDDWKMYALFICFGNTERCLSYDEKPLMLFQKLKESGQKPVFMLRHIRDIRSPIAVAQQKQAVKLGLPPNSTANVLPSIKPAETSTTSPTKTGGVPYSTDTRLHRPPVLHPVTAQAQPGLRAGDEGQTPNGGAFPELPSPGLKDGHDLGRSTASGTLVDKDGNLQKVTYAISIYPYIADRQDEFDVAVGATFVILSKAKGWWIVQKDPDGLGNVIPDQSKSGWVPAGCLLELSSPISAVSPTTPDGTLTLPGRSPLPPSAIMSSSYPGVVLMDYEAKGEDELSLKEGDKIRVYKKYCHWSYSILQETGERGWVPAWFIGKLGTGSDSQPSSAATPTGPVLSAGTTQGSETSSGGDEIGKKKEDESSVYEL